MLNSPYSGIIKIVMADDHLAFREALCKEINSWENYKVTFQADNGQQLVEQITEKSKPDIVVLDINMKPMNGYETAKYLRNIFPDTKIIALTMFDSEEAAIQMIRSGANGFLSKTNDIIELKRAFSELMKTGHYFHNGFAHIDRRIKVNFNETEIQFLKHACSDLKYETIAKLMNMTEGRVDKLREKFFEHFEVKTRQALAVKAINTGLISV